MQKVRYAAPDPTLPRPWRGLVDSATRNLYFWNPETNVTTYVRPTADPQPPHPDIDNRSDRSHQIHGVVDLGGCGDDVNNGDPSHQSQGVNRDTSSQLNDKQSVPVSEAHGEEHGHKHEPTVLAKRKDTSKSNTLKKTYSKKQKTTSPPLVVDATEGHVEELIMKPTEVSHSVEKGQQESNEVHKTDQLAKETRKAKRKDTSKSHTLRKTYSKKQKTTSPPLVVDATEDHVEDSIMKPTEVSHSVEKGQQDSDEVHKTNQLAKKTRKAKRKDTSKSHTLKKTYSKKQKTTSPPLVVDATEGHVEESIMKPTEASHSVEKGQQESDEVHKTDQLAKETRKAKRKDTSKSHILKKTYSKKQRTISPPLVVDATEGHVEKSFMKLTEGHVEKSFMKPTEVTHSVEKGQQESLEVHKTGQLAKETQKMSEVEGEVPQSASTNGAELLQANRSETFEMNAISSICTTLVAKEMDNSLHEELPIMGTDPNQELLSIADGPEGLGKEIIDRDGLMDQDGGPIIDNLSNYNVDCPTIDSTKIEANLEKQPIKRSLAPSIDKVEEDLALSESIDRLAGVTDQLFGAVEAMRYMIQYTVSARETEAQRRRENEGLKKNVLDLKRKVADLEAKLKETMMGNQHARCQFLGSKIAGS